MTNSLGTIPLDVKENYEHALGFSFHLSRFFSVCPEPSVPFKQPCTADAFFPRRLYNHYHNHNRLIFSEICIKFVAVPLSDPSRNRIRTDTGLQINGRKKLTRPPSYVKFCTLTPEILQYYHLPLHRATTTAE
jgi:hypothetical protein